MVNFWLWVLELAVCFAGILIAYRLFGKTGLYVWIALSTIVANIQVLKTVQLFGMVTTLGNVVYGTSFLATDILSENHSQKEARMGVYVGIFAIVFTTVMMQMSLQFIPDESDFAQASMETLFSILPRITLASITAYFVSQLHDVWAYHFWMKRKPKLLWLRNNASTMVSQLIDSVIFHAIAFIGIFPFDIVLQIFIVSYVMKWVVALLDTPFMYLARRMKPAIES